MKIKFLAVLLLTSCSSLIFAQDDNVVLMTINDKPVYRSEFEYIFKKNNKDTVITKESLDEYINLFINFKLKVLAAEELQMDTMPKFKQELAGYRNQLSKPYLTDKTKIDDFLQEAYNRMQWDINASHILIKCDFSASPEDSLKAYNKAIVLRNRIVKNGEKFEDVAVSQGGLDDPSAAKNKGALGYFTAFKMVYPFETAAYNTPVGEVSMPVRTRFGYHLIYVKDKRPARGQLHVAHLMLELKDDANENKVADVKAKINEIYELTKTVSFDELVKKYSEDQSSAKKGGELNWFGTGRMVPEFEEAAYALQNDGDISKPFQTSFGWHIVKRLEAKPIPEFAKAKASIRQKIAKDSRAQIMQKSFVEKLKKDYNFFEHSENIKYLLPQIDTNIFKGKWKVSSSKKLNNTLFSFADSTVTVMDFAKYLEKTQRPQKDLNVENYVSNKYKAFLNSTLIGYENSRLEEKYYDFKMLMKEYRDGILLFQLTEDKVWGKAMKDTSGLMEFYENNSNDFMWKDRADVTIYKCKDEAIAKKVRSYLKKKKDEKFILANINKDTHLNISIEHKVVEKGENEIADSFEWKVGLSANTIKDGQTIFVELNELLPQKPKTLDEAKGLITAAYQKYLEDNWITELRANNTVKVNYEDLYKIK